MPFVPMELFADRTARIQASLGERGLRAPITTTPDTFFMVSGFQLDVAPWERPVAAVNPRVGPPFLVVNQLSTNHRPIAAERGSLSVRDIELPRPGKNVAAFDHEIAALIIAEATEVLTKRSKRIGDQIAAV